jgi:vancomycin resistance protein YoaR
VLHADLEVVERRAHGLTVSYLPYGNDATVDWGSNTDFKFRNNTDFPIKIETSVRSRE